MLNEIPAFNNAEILRRRPLLSQAVGIGLALGGARYYLSHPRRVVARLPADLEGIGRDVFLTAEDGARLHGVWLPVLPVLSRLPVRVPWAGRAGQDEVAHRPESHRAVGERTIVHYHGFNGSGGMLLARSPKPLLAWSLVRAALARNYNFLLVDVRGHGQSDGPWDPSGFLPASDLIQWVCWLRETQDQLWVGLWGNSFGAAVGLGLATRPACGGFDAMVLDSVVVSASGLYSGLIRRPAYWLVQPVLWQLGNHVLLEALRSTSVSVPILLIHGMDDTHVPSWHSQQAYGLTWRADDPERVALWLVPGADHLEALQAVPELYVQRAVDWFDRWFGGSS